MTENGAVARARTDQARWAATPIAERLRLLGRARRLLVERAGSLANSVGRAGAHARTETLAAEILPLADALRFLEREAAHILRPRRPGRRLEIRRRPLGVVLVIAPGNYPLFLPGVQLAQALAAGNAVLLKPAPGDAEAAEALQALFLDAGLAPALLQVLPESVTAARRAIEDGVDHVILTGSATTGRAVLQDLAPRLTPATLELSGCDAVFVRPDADLDLVAAALRFGLSFNDSRTCIAPRRVFVPRALVAPLVERLEEALSAVPSTPLDERTGAQIERLAGAALEEGARLAVGALPTEGRMRPIVLADVGPGMEIARSDVFAPVLSLLAIEDDEDALAQAACCPYALGATVFGSARGARALAERVDAGVVIVNDMIAPTADPQIPFGGHRESGYGVTRGAEGLLALTAPKTVVEVRGRRRRHLDLLRGGEDRLFLAWLRVVHGASWRGRTGALFGLVREVMRYGRRSNGEEGTDDGEI